jgi:heat shock protein HslJ
MNRQEGTFLKALGDARTWKVTGDTLVLSGEAGPVARFTAQYMK